MKDFLWTPVIPWPLIALGAAAALAGIAWTLWRGLKSHARALLLAAFRLLALAVIVVMMLQPQKRYDEVTILKPQLAVLIDGSESMSDPVDDAQPNRAARVKEWLASPVIEKARESFDLRLFSFDSKITELPTASKDVKFLGGVSNIVGALTEVQQRFTGQPLAGIALLTDGLDTTGQAPAAAFTSAVPVFTFELEKEFTRKEAERRISLGSLDYPARVQSVRQRAGVQGVKHDVVLGSSDREVPLWPLIVLRPRGDDKAVGPAMRLGGADRHRAAGLRPARGRAGLEVRVADQVVPVGDGYDEIVHEQIGVAVGASVRGLVEVGRHRVHHPAGQGRVAPGCRREVDGSGDLRPHPAGKRDAVVPDRQVVRRARRPAVELILQRPRPEGRVGVLHAPRL